MSRSSRSVVDTALVVAMAMVLAACGGDDDGSSGTTSTTEANGTATTTVLEDTTTTTTESVPADEEAAAVAAYEAHWAVFYAFLNGEQPGDPADHFTGARLADLPGSIADFAEREIEARGAPDMAPGPVTIDGDRASFMDCQLDETYGVSRSTGEVVTPPATELQPVSVQMQREDGQWKVASVIYEEGGCTR